MIEQLIEGGFVITMDPQRRVLADAAVAVEGDRIVDLGPTGALRSKYPGAKRIGGPNRLVAPGLINTHAHLNSSLARGMLDDIDVVTWCERLFYWYYPHVDEETYYYMALLALIEMVKSGTTTVVDCGTHPGVEHSAVKAVEDVGLRAVLGRIEWDVFDGAAFQGVPPSMRETTEQALVRGEDFVRRYHGAVDGRVQAWLNIHQVPNASDELTRGIGEIARRHGVGVMTHAAVSEALVGMTLRRHGMRDVERMEHFGLLGPNFLAAHVACLDGRELMLLGARQANVAHLCGSGMHGAYGPVSRGRFPEMVQMGVNVTIGTDGAGLSNHFDMVRQLYLVAVAHKEMRLDPVLFRAGEVLQMGTVNGAKAVGWQDKVGSLEPGKQADVVLFNLDRPGWIPYNRANVLSNLVYSATGDSVDTVLVGGKVVVEGGQIKTVDERQVIARCQEIGQRLVESADWL